MRAAQGRIARRAWVAAATILRMAFPQMLHHLVEECPIRAEAPMEHFAQVLMSGERVFPLCEHALHGGGRERTRVVVLRGAAGLQHLDYSSLTKAVSRAQHGSERTMLQYGINAPPSCPLGTTMGTILLNSQLPD